MQNVKAIVLIIGVNDILFKRKSEIEIKDSMNPKWSLSNAGYT